MARTLWEPIHRRWMLAGRRWVLADDPVGAGYAGDGFASYTAPLAFRR